MSVIDASTLVWVVEYHLIICTACTVAVRSSQLRSHFRDKHSTPNHCLPLIDRWLQGVCLQHDLPPDFPAQLPRTFPHPLPHLPVYHDYYRCQFEPATCSYVCHSFRDIRSHLTRAHEHSTCPRSGRPYSISLADGDLPVAKTACQRPFRSGEGSHYIAIDFPTPALADEPTLIAKPSLWDQLDQRVQIVRSSQADLVSPEPDKGGDAWVRRTGWENYLRGFSRSKLLTLVSLPTRDTPEWPYIEAVDRLVQSSQALLQDGRTAYFVRLVLATSSPTTSPTRPLQPYLSPQDCQRSTRYWKQILLFFLRAPALDLADRPTYRLPAAAHSALERVVLEHQRTVAPSSNIPAESDHVTPDHLSPTYALSPLESACLEFFIHLLDDRIVSSDYDCPLTCALSVLGIHSNHKGWKTAHEYPSLLSGVIKVARFLVLRSAYERHRDQTNNDGPPLEAVQAMVFRFMVHGTYGPIHWSMALRAYGLSIAHQTTGTDKVLWTGETALYGTIQLTLQDFRGGVHRLLNDTRELLLDRLLFRQDIGHGVPDIPWDQLRDEPHNTTAGWSFLQSHGHTLPVQGDTWLTHAVASSAVLASAFTHATRPDAFDEARVRDYLADLRQFRVWLAVLCHLSAQPARASELLSIRHQNSSQGALRDVFIDDGMVVLVTRYYKGAYHHGDTRIIHRFLPRAVGELMVYYVWLVIPWVQRIECQHFGVTAFSSHVWPNDTPAAPITETSFCQKLPLVFQTYCGQEINVRAYRHLAVSIARQFLHQAWDTPGHEEDGDDPELDDNVWDLQAAHSTRTANVVYGRTVGQLPGEQASRRLEFRHISLVWHRFLHLDSVDPVPRPDVDEAAVARVLRKRFTSLNASSPFTQLRVLCGPTADFRYNQAEALDHLYRGHTPLLVVMPTGGGKSMLFAIPASYDFSAITVVVVPLVALSLNLHHRLGRLSIPSHIWVNGRAVPEACRILLVTVEAAVTDAFLQTVHRLRAHGRLDRIVVDECHVVLLEDGSFRPAILQLSRLVQVPVPLVFLTATLPIDRETEFWSRLKLTDLRTYTSRVSSRQPYHQLRVLKKDQGWIQPYGPHDKVAEHVQSARERGGRTVVYCSSVNLVQQVARAVQGLPYFASFEDKEESLEAFRCRQDAVIVATSALGLGVHLDDIRTVIHYGPPPTLLDYVQQCGRGGRDGQPTLCLLMIPFNSRVGCHDSWVSRYLALPGTECRRQLLARYLDGAESPSAVPCRATIFDEELCDLCEARAEQATTPLVLNTPPPSSPLQLVRHITEEKDYRQSCQQLEATRHAVGDTHRREASDLATFLDWLRVRASRCLLCIATGHEAHAPTPAACPSPLRERWATAKLDIKNQVTFMPYSACWSCGYPQALCRHWVKVDRGFHQSPSLQCEHRFVLFEAAAVFLFLIDSIDDRVERLKTRLNLEQLPPPARPKALIQKLGQKVRFMGIEASVLFREVYYWYIKHGG